MTWKRAFLPTLLLAGLLAAFTLHAQSGHGIIRGTLTDAKSGEAVNGGFIILEEAENYVVEYSTMASSDGSFELVRIEPKTYRLTAVASGYDSLETSLEVSGGDTLELNLALEPLEE